MRAQSCHYANRVRVTVRGTTKLLGCGSRALFGPLPPKQTHRVRAVALKMRGRKVLRRQRISSSEVYLPGDDGNWVRVR